MGKKKELNKIARDLGWIDVDHMEMNLKDSGSNEYNWLQVVKKLLKKKHRSKKKIKKIVLEVIHSKKEPFEDSELIAIFSQEFNNIAKEIAEKLTK